MRNELVSGSPTTVASCPRAFSNSPRLRVSFSWAWATCVSVRYTSAAVASPDSRRRRAASRAVSMFFSDCSLTRTSASMPIRL